MSRPNTLIPLFALLFVLVCAVAVIRTVFDVVNYRCEVIEAPQICRNEFGTVVECPERDG